MNYSSTLHPDGPELAAYLQQTNSAEHSDISLHLAVCVSCREQLAMMSLLKKAAADLVQQVSNEQQQQIVDDFIYGQLDDDKKESVKADIKKNPLLLKSVLHSLSQQPENVKLENRSKTQSSPAVMKLIDWLHNFTTSWLSIPVTAFATVLLSVLVFQLFDLLTEPQDSISIAGYQDDNSMRFVQQNNTPGIGFFSSAKQHEEPYQNIKISLKENQLLELEWQAVKNAEDYNLTLSRFSDGKKIIRDKMTTSQTRSTVKLTEADFNQRFEWTLSGVTTQQNVFITEGGFVINRKTK